MVDDLDRRDLIRGIRNLRKLDDSLARVKYETVPFSMTVQESGETMHKVITAISLFSKNRITLLAWILLVCCPAWAADDNQAPSSIAGLAGKYYSGDGLGFNMTLVIKPEGGFSYESRGCTGKYAEANGAATIANGVITLKPEGKVKQQPFTLIPVRWDERLYLVDKEKLLEFCNDVNQGSEPRKDAHGSAYIRIGDERKVVSGPPNLPGEWRTFLLRKPVVGVVVKMISAYKAEVNLGAEDGIKKGMTLTAHGKKDVDFTQLRVLETSPHACIVECDSIEIIPSADRDLVCHLEKGQTVSTRFER